MASLLLLLAVVALFALPDVPFSIRALAAALTAILALAIHSARLARCWKRGGWNPSFILFNHIFGAVLGFASGVIAGTVSGYLLEGMDLPSGQVSIAGEAIVSGFFGFLLGLAVGVTSDRRRHLLVGAVSGFAGSTAAAGIKAIYPGTTPTIIALSALVASPTGVAIGALTGLTFHNVHRIILAAFPRVGERIPPKD